MGLRGGVMKITADYLKQLNACPEAVIYTSKLPEMELVDLIKFFQADPNPSLDNKFNWISWLLVSLMTKEQRLKYAIFSAQQVIPIFEKQYPNDTRPADSLAIADSFVASIPPDASNTTQKISYSSFDLAKTVPPNTPEFYAGQASLLLNNTMLPENEVSDFVDVTESASNADPKVQQTIIDFGLSLLGLK